MSKDSVKSIAPLSFPWETSDPFLFCVHHEDFYPKANDKMGPDVSLAGRNIGNDFESKDGFRMYHGQSVPGFPAHPHRGFETVTIARTGYVDHSDSLGMAGRFGGGDVQWMTAGKGVQHSEMFPLLDTEKENPFELFQIWLNLPKNKKMAEPHFAMLWTEDIPTVTKEDEQGKKSSVRVIAGEFSGNKAPDPAPNSWAADPANQVAIWTIKMEPGASLTLPAVSEGINSEGINRTIYFFKGKDFKASGHTVSPYHSVKLHSELETVLENGDEEAEVLLLQGKPIDEPVAQYGPFVMNTMEEIQEAMNEFRQTEFGGWPWPTMENVHEKSKTRFAKYADGRLETKSL